MENESTNNKEDQNSKYKIRMTSLTEDCSKD